MNTGKASATVKGTGKYFGSRSVTFNIKQASNTITKVTPTEKTLRREILERKDLSFQLKATDLFGAKKTFALDKEKTKAKAQKYIKVSKIGTVIVKKGTPKGTYNEKVKVTAAGTKNYTAKTSAKTVRVIVK